MGTDVEHLARERLSELRQALLDLHRTLLDDERHAHERMFGRQSPGALLRLALEHPQFAWLHPVSRLIVRIDALLAGEFPMTRDEVVDVAGHAHALLKPSEHGSEFERRYDRAMQHNPSVLVAHGAAMRAVKRLTAW